MSSTSTCSSPGGISSGFGGMLSTGRKAQRVVKASSTAPVITNIERPKSAHQDHEDALKNKGMAGAGFLGIEDSFDKALSLPSSPVSKEQPSYDITTKKTHETKKAQRRHHTHHLFDGILHTISGGSNENKGSDHTRDNKNSSKQSSETLSETQETLTSPIRRWSETTSPQNIPSKVVFYDIVHCRQHDY